MPPKRTDMARLSSPGRAEMPLTPPCATWLTVEGARALWQVCALVATPQAHLPIRSGRTDAGALIFFVGYRLARA
jgi:hypothetical protein